MQLLSMMLRCCLLDALLRRFPGCYVAVVVFGCVAASVVVNIGVVSGTIVLLSVNDISLLFIIFWTWQQILPPFLD